jgi:hypothetical protein
MNLKLHWLSRSGRLDLNDELFLEPWFKISLMPGPFSILVAD